MTQSKTSNDILVRRDPLVLAHTALMLAAGLVLLWHLFVYGAYAANLIAFPFDYDQGEGFELVDTVLFSQGQWPYRDTEAYPFYSSNYPPLFHVMAAPFVWFFGPAYWYGRLLGFLGTLVTAAAIALAVYREGGHRWVAVFSGLAFLASNTIYHIGPLFRQHATMVMFEMLAVLVLSRFDSIPDARRRRWTLAVGLLLIIAAGYTKQLAAITALAVGVFLFIRGPLRAVAWGAFAAAVGVAIFVWMNWATGGEWWRQAILANVNNLNVIQSVALFRLWFGLHGFLIIPALLLVAYELYWDRLSIYTIWFVIATVIGGASSGTWGGGDSYFASSIAALCVLSGIFAARTLRGKWAFAPIYLTRPLIKPLRRFAPLMTRAALIIIPLLYLGYGRAVLHMPTDGPIFGPVAAVLGVTPNALNGFYDSARTADGQFPGGYANIGHFVTEADHEAGWAIVARINATDAPVLSEEAGFSLAAGRDVITNPTQLLNLANNNMFDGSELIGMIEAREFGLVILRAQFYPVPVLQALGQHYMRDEVIAKNGFEYMLLRPRPDVD